jgi:WXG100 family type VII secretion target
MSDLPVKAQYQLMEDSSRAMQELRSVMEGRLSLLRREVEEVCQTWTGSSQAAWRTHQANWDSAFQELTTLLNGIAISVEEAKALYQRTEMDVVKDFNGASIPSGRIH